MALYGKYRGRYLGYIRRAGYSKLPREPRISRAEKGGAVLINDAQFNERAEILREKGNRSKPIFSRRGRQVHVGRLSGRAICHRDLLAAFLRAQLETPRIRFSRGDDKSGRPTSGASWLPGPKQNKACGSRLSHPNANRLTTCFM